MAEKKENKGPLGELGEVLGELDVLLKNPDVGAALADRGVNISLALVGVEGLRAYLSGDKARAAEEFSTLAEEVTSRLEAARALARDKPS
jgi:Ser/Thr protein kinase RdoA (MazF antagonist)